MQSGLLGNRLVGILHSCLRHHSPYNEHTAWATPRATAATRNHKGRGLDTAGRVGGCRVVGTPAISGTRPAHPRRVRAGAGG